MCRESITASKKAEACELSQIKRTENKECFIATSADALETSSWKVSTSSDSDDLIIVGLKFLE